jgi:riboflavin synthase alpha subunit
MTNVKAYIDGDKLHIEVDVSAAVIKAAPPSKSGKTKVVATTSGFVAMNGVSFGLNVVTK